MNNHENQAFDYFEDRSGALSNEDELNREKNESNKKGVKNPKWTRVMSLNGYM
jgi:hypothetical protein